MILGIDASTLPKLIDNGVKFYDNNKECDPLEVFNANGVSYMRIRIWNNPKSATGELYGAGDNDYNQFIRLAKMSIAKGYKILLDFHYSDFWADPAKQYAPKEWTNLSFEEVEAAIYGFTFDTLINAKKDGVEVAMVQIGNEITNGLCWPFGKLIDNGAGKERGNYEAVAKLLKSGIKAAKDANPNIKTIIHLEKSYDTAIYYEFFSNMRKYNVEYDIIGASYYPYWHGTFEELFNTLKMCQNTFKKPTMVMELAYAFTVEDYDSTVKQNVVNDESYKQYDKFSFVYPFSPAGQASFIEAFLKAAKENGVEGVFYWEPLWVPDNITGWASMAAQEYIHENKGHTRNEWANQCLFDYNGNKLPAVDKYKI